MHYEFRNIQVPQSSRQLVNNNILDIVESGNLKEFTKENIFNAYTGIGGLHRLKRSDYDNYSEYSEEKKILEIGQFFTPPIICREIIEILEISTSDFVGEICCGSGNFLNYLPNLRNVYGCDIEENALDVAKFLYPEANLENTGLQYYNPGLLFDVIIGNPPFNLRLNYSGKSYSSQELYILKANELLKPGGMLAFICPFAFLNDSVYYANTLKNIDQNFNFVASVRLPLNAFAQYGAIFETKVIFLQKKADCLKYNVNYNSSYVVENFNEAAKALVPFLEGKESAKSKLILELSCKTKEISSFEYKANKFLFEIKHQMSLKDAYPKALGLVQQLNSQVKPANMSLEKWEEVKLTPKSVLNILKEIVKSQNIVPKDCIRLVKTNYSIKYKAFSKKAQQRLDRFQSKTNFSINDIVIGKEYEIFKNLEGVDYSYLNYWNLINQKKKDFQLHSQPFRYIEIDSHIEDYLNNFRFDTPKEKFAKFGEIQKIDLNKVIQKKIGILGWQQGSGKTPGAWAWGNYRLKHNFVRNVFILSSGISINITWTDFFNLNNQSYVNVKSLEDILSIGYGDFVLISVDFLIKYEKQIKKFVKQQGQKVAFIFDESDEITNAMSKRTKAALNCFRKSKYKLLATGTTTRNNINELYSQLELLTNNSYNFICDCEYIYKETVTKKKEEVDFGTKIRKLPNEKNLNSPFPAYSGKSLFMYCFNPSKKTVFGIEKNNQDVYNQENLISIIEKFIITRKFKEIAGKDKYKIIHHTVSMNQQEQLVYRDLLENATTAINLFYGSTGNSRKDAMLRALHQLQLLIKATSIPQVFNGYGNINVLPNKFNSILAELERLDNCKVAIGLTTVEAIQHYSRALMEKFPFRPLFIICGNVGFNKRKQIIKDFESTVNGVLLCTQQSLKNSVNIPSCKEVFIESMQWNFPKMEQFYFRFIRYNSVGVTNVRFFTYEKTIEINLLSLVVAKESLNDFIKTLDFKDETEMMEELDFDLTIVNELLVKEKDEDGNVRITWGQRNVA